MNYQFMQQVAPQIALPPRGQWVTPEQDTPIYGGTDSNGERIPLNYIRDQGGPTQYYAPGNAGGLSVEGDPMRATTRSAPMPIQGLRGLSPPEGSPNDTLIPSMGQSISRSIPSMAAPQNLMERGRAGIREAPVAGARGMRMLNPEQQTPGQYYPGPMQPGVQHGTRVQAPIPPAHQAPTNMDYSRQLMDVGGQNTLLDMFELSQFRIPDVLRNLSGPRRTAPGGEMQQTPVQDLRGRQTGETQRTSQWNRSPNFNLSTPEGLAEFNDRMGLELGDQIRTREEQRRLYEAHQTPTLDSYHITGEAFDVRPEHIGGLTGENAVNAVLTRMRQARYNVDDYEVKWETGVGPNQGTGAHVHVEPRRRRR